jgi:cytochrome c-type biogenesis protein CcsB
MLNILFFSALATYLIASIIQFVGAAFKKEGIKDIAWWLSILGFALLTVYMVLRGIEAKRLPMSNQFEFATAFAWGVGLLNILLHLKLKQDWESTIALPAIFLIISYAAFLPREIYEIMPALKSAWFSLHIGSAVFSYAAFALAGCMGIRYIISYKKNKDDKQLIHNDYLSYRLIAFGFLMLTVVILSGCIWAEQAWSVWWSWDPKETWALITWIIYAMYLHQRIRIGWQGIKMAWFAIIAVVCVLFTFVGVNTLLSGLHSYF